MGSFWGPNDTMKEAAGFPREYANWNYAQYQDWLNRQNQYAAKGDYATQQSYDYYNQMLQSGIGSPEDIWTAGQLVMPGVDEVNAAQKSRLEQILAQYQSLPQTADTMAKIGETQQQLADLVKRTGDTTTAEISDTASRAFGRETAASTEINADLLKRYHELGLDVDTDYGSMRGTNKSVYGGLKESGETAYSDAQAEVEKLRPGSEFKQAQTARSFAPEVAETAGRLRRAGIDPSSPQGIAAMQRVQAQRSRAMDDAAAEGTSEFVKARNDLILGLQGTRERLGTSELGNELTLAGQQSGLKRDLSLEQGEGLRGETTRHLGAEQNIDLTRSTRQTQEEADAYGRTQDYLNTANTNALLERDMSRQDWQTESDIAREQTSADVASLNRKNEQFGAGMNYRLTDLNERQQGAQGIYDYGTNQTNNAFKSASTALGFGNAAATNYSTAYDYNAAKAGWGTKMLAAAAPYALSAIPGVGPYLAAGTEALAGGSGYGTTGTTGTSGTTGANRTTGTTGSTRRSSLDYWKQLNASMWNRNPYQQGKNQGTGE